jgi:hypothetical protein
MFVHKHSLGDCEKPAAATTIIGRLWKQRGQSEFRPAAALVCSLMRAYKERQCLYGNNS